jgi:hypothetical protein
MIQNNSIDHLTFRLDKTKLALHAWCPAFEIKDGRRRR